MEIDLPFITNRYKVKSKSNPELFYTVEIWSNGKMHCECIAGMMNRECRHIKIVKKHNDKLLLRG